MKIKQFGAAVLVCSSVLAGLSAHGEKNASNDDALAKLQAGFQNPPAEARPRVWWHWMNGNISKAGIRADIEWMSRIGIGGLQHFDAALNTPQLVDERLVYMTPAWKKAFRYAAQQADAHDLELAVAGSPGWSETGGPWVKPEDGMKKLVWSELDLEGGERFAGALPPLPDIAGLFQDAPNHDVMLASSDVDNRPPAFARDERVLAFPVAPDSASLTTPLSATVAGEPINAALLVDGRYGESIAIDGGDAEQPAVIELRYAQPQTVRNLTVFLPGAAGGFRGAKVAPVLEVDEGEESWRTLAEVSLTEVPTTVTFPAVKATRFRLVLNPLSGISMGDANRMGVSPGVDARAMFSVFGQSAPGSLAAAMQVERLQLAELALGSEPRVAQFELKAGFTVAGDYYALEPTTTLREQAVPADSVVDLTDRMSVDGRLDWTPPPGRWRVLRLGYSLTGKSNHPAPPEATGLEVDKFDGGAVRRYMETYLANYRDAAGEDLLGERGLRALLTDSIEVGPANWTPALVAEFRTRRGYDPVPWLPVLTGVVVGSGADSDAFLYDYRLTLAELIASQHYGTIAEVAREHGLTYYSEAVETIRTTLGDDMAMRSHADVPMAAMWTYGEQGPTPGYILDIRGAASVAHVYGQNLVAAESLTSVLQPWNAAPADLRPVMDLIFAHGVNRPVIHTSVHQPADDKYPGLALLIFGQYFNRHETWAEMAEPWVTYMARSSFLLQQGRHTADVAYFYGQEAPLTKLFEQGLPADAPRHYGFDFVNADALLEALHVENGELVSRGGARYRVLYLGGSSLHMTVPVLRRLAELADAGATIVGKPPRSTPSLADDANEFAALRVQLWGVEPVSGSSRKVGSGAVIHSDDVEAVLASRGIVPDFDYASGNVDGEILFQHRSLDDADIYFLSNRAKEVQRGEARFRVTGRVPEIWRADSGERRYVSYRMDGDVTVVDLDMAPEDAFFVVFARATDKREASFPVPQWSSVADIGGGSWGVRFQEGRGAPAGITLENLLPLNEHEEPGVRYFSGTARYSKSFDLPEGLKPGDSLQLDLGEIGEVAEIYVNGKLAGTAWRKPYRVDIGPHVRAGSNALEVRVANLWVNRLVGDVQPDAEKVTWTSTPIYLPDAPLRDSGLVGPVRLLSLGAN